MTRRGLVSAVVLAVCGSLLASMAASATYPGKNGHIVFREGGGTTTSSANVRLLNPRTRVARTLLSCPFTRCQLGDAAVSPDGRTIAIHTMGANPDGQPAPQIGLLGIDDGNWRTVPYHGYQPYTPATSLAVLRLFWSPSSNALVLYAYNILSGDGFYLTSLDGTVGPKIWDHYGGNDVSAFGSPVGAIAYTYSPESHTPAATYVRELNGRERSVASCWVASFAPDGKRMLCLGPNAAKVTRTDGRGRRHYLGQLQASLATWSPDGKKIAYRGTKGIYLIKATGGRPRLIYKAPIRSDGSGVQIGSLDWQARP